MIYALRGSSLLPRPNRTCRALFTAELPRSSLIRGATPVQAKADRTSITADPLCKINLNKRNHCAGTGIWIPVRLDRTRHPGGGGGYRGSSTLGSSVSKLFHIVGCGIRIRPTQSLVSMNHEAMNQLKVYRVLTTFLLIK